MFKLNVGLVLELLNKLTSDGCLATRFPAFSIEGSMLQRLSVWEVCGRYGTPNKEIAGEGCEVLSRIRKFAL